MHVISPRYYRGQPLRIKPSSFGPLQGLFRSGRNEERERGGISVGIFQSIARRYASVEMAKHRTKMLANAALFVSNMYFYNACNKNTTSLIIRSCLPMYSSAHNDPHKVDTRYNNFLIIYIIAAVHHSPPMLDVRLKKTGNSNPSTPSLCSLALN